MFFSFFLALILCHISVLQNQNKIPKYLSEYGFFQSPLNQLNPQSSVFPYEVNSALFSDYALKRRHIFLPKNTKISIPDSSFQLIDFPIGTVLIKSFYYYTDKNKEKQTLVETRLLQKTNKEWKAFNYVWNQDQTDAKLTFIGAEKEITFYKDNGKKQKILYQAPNTNQCKSCHNQFNKLLPIGTIPAQLDFYSQLDTWNKANILSGYHNNRIIETLSSLSETTVSINNKARSYLHSNCSHCHNSEGSANTSGLFLNYNQENESALGFYKAPIAAGKGSGGRPYSIYPGEPNKSILLYRMIDNDPGIKMPEIGRQVAHKEGIETIKTWIQQLEK